MFATERLEFPYIDGVLHFSLMSQGQTPSILLVNLPPFHMTRTWHPLKHWNIWKCLGSGWAGLWGTWSGWGCPCLWQGAGPCGLSRLLPTQNHFRILCNACTGLAAAGELAGTSVHLRTFQQLAYHSREEWGQRLVIKMQIYCSSLKTELFLGHTPFS